jgi:hypothetical protein
MNEVKEIIEQKTKRINDLIDELLVIGQELEFSKRDIDNLEAMRTRAKNKMKRQVKKSL